MTISSYFPSNNCIFLLLQTGLHLDLCYASPYLCFVFQADAGGSPALVARGFGATQSGSEVHEMQVPNEKVKLVCLSPLALSACRY